MASRRKKKTIFTTSKNFLRFVFKRKFLAFCLLVLATFLFIGRCSKNDYTYRSLDELAYMKILRARYSGNGRVVSIRSAKADIAEACEFATSVELNSRWDSPDLRDLLLATAAVETGMRARFQDSGGDAIGLFQVEYGTFRDLWRRAMPIKYPKLYRATQLRFGDAINGEIKFEDLQKNDILCALFALVKYVDSGKTVPMMSDVEGQARYYKEIYNTADGKSNVEKFIKSKSEIISKTYRK